MKHVPAIHYETVQNKKASNFFGSNLSVPTHNKNVSNMGTFLETITLEKSTSFKTDKEEDSLLWKKLLIKKMFLSLKFLTDCNRELIQHRA
ncbi:hypothetical protein [Candidatus Parabeggiatoa sp. HSG14]|uniref:hypothetical protein n=1 Tax=Candidatus Parabeggiatoa sp. HSG14 TaxID=3055593 RepID=UPI0025A7C393|nr:hypothetical protein [Thiotrichales bacterium HSG14]